jgi:hypothetical protein
MCIAPEYSATQGGPPGTMLAQREHTGSLGAQRRLRKTFVRIDFVQATIAEVINYRAS